MGKTAVFPGGYGRIGVYRVNTPSRGGDLVSTLPGCVCPKVKDMGPFWASRE